MSGLMQRQMRYGEDSVLTLDVDTDSVLADFSEPRCESVDDPAEAIVAALANPIHYPPLVKAIVPGDRIVIAVAKDIPQIDVVLGSIVNVLVDSGVEAHSIVVVQAERASADFLLQRIPDGVRQQIRVEQHEPSNITDLMYVGATRDSRPIYFNRTIGDADFVIPVGLTRIKGSFGYFGAYSGLYPTFSDDATQRRFQERLKSKENSAKRRRAEAEEAAQRLGIQFSIQITPGPRNSIWSVAAGEPHSVAHESRRRCQEAWLCHTDSRASLIVATIEGDQSHQTWESFSRALFAASRGVEEDGVIVLCTDLRATPGPALRHMAMQDQDDFEDRDRPRARRPKQAPDVMVADLLKRLRRRARVFLLSGLDEDLVNGLGMGYVSDPSEVANLSRRHSTCILLGNADLAMLATEEG